MSYSRWDYTIDSGCKILKLTLNHKIHELYGYVHPQTRNPDIWREGLSPLRFAQGQALSPCASLRGNSAKGLARRAQRSFAALRMTARTPLQSASGKSFLQTSEPYTFLLTKGTTSYYHATVAVWENVLPIMKQPVERSEKQGTGI